MRIPDAKMLEAVTEIAKEAGEAITTIYRTGFTVTHKPDNSPVTNADMASHHIIRRRLQDLTPEWPVLSEEDPSSDFAQRSQWPIYWLVDPLDGTREFIHYRDTFCVNIGLVSGSAVILGVIHGPILGLTYSALKGYGAFKQEGQQATHAIEVSCWQQSLPLKVAVSRSHSSPLLKQFLEQIGPHELVSMGSALKIGLVAEGKVDLYPRFGPTWEWDTAAGQCVVEQAGGALTDANLRPLQYNTKESLINPSFLVAGKIPEPTLQNIRLAAQQMTYRKC